MRIENLKILTGKWNVGQGRAFHDSLISWLGSAASDVGIFFVVGLQEVEMGAGVLAMSTAKETVRCLFHQNFLPKYVNILHIKSVK